MSRSISYPNKIHSFISIAKTAHHNHAAKIVDELEKQGIIGPPDGVRPRQVIKKYSEGNS